MDPSDRLFNFRHAFDQPVTTGIVAGVTILLVVSFPLIALLSRAGKIGPELRTELILRVRSWAVLAPAVMVPILLGAAWTILAITILSILCYREFARATGLFRERLISALIVLGIFLIGFSVADHWYGFFVALASLTVIVIAIAAILYDRPAGYIQRVGLGSFGFLLFGVCFGHLAYIANNPNYRPIILLIFVAVELNDIFAYISGKTMGRRKLAPHTSPNKTLGGALGALVLTSSLVAILGHLVFSGQAMDDPVKLIGLGLIVSIAGQMGDLMLSSIKRDIGIKDMGATIPGHGGFLDRFDSLILVGPAVFHYVNYFQSFNFDQTVRIISGNGS
jgi:phosphatidate cytidylyltransferase